MIRGVLLSVALLALLLYAVYRMVDVYQRVTPERVTRVDVYADHIAYRNNQYPTTSAFAVGLKATQDPPQILGLHDCSATGSLESVLGILRAEGYMSLKIEMPDEC